MDGTAFIFRGFYANRLQRSDGFPTNALYVVSRLLLRILREEKPSHFVFLMDGRGKNFRHELYPLYKANRDATPEDLVKQLDPVKSLVGHLGLHLEVSNGCEADDCIASLAKRYAKERPVIIIGADKDLRQCLSPNVWLWDPAAKEEKLFSAESFTLETGLQPSQWPDVQALIGDSSDNIPGVPGIGPKTAQKIFMDFSSLEDISQGLNRLPPKLEQKIAPHVDEMFLYRKLTTLSTDECLHIQEEDMRIKPIIPQDIGAFLQEYELASLRREVESMLRAGILQGADNQSVQNPEPSLLNLAQNPSKDASANKSTQNSTQVQASLFAFSSDVVLQEHALVPKVSVLPILDKELVSILPASYYPNARQEQGLVLGVGGKEYHVDVTKELVEKLSHAKCIISPDVKSLMRSNAIWYDIPLQLWFDLGLAAYLQNPEERDYSWPRLASQWRKFLQDESSAPAILALGIWADLSEKLGKQNLNTLYYDLELPLIAVLASMEGIGIAVNPVAFKEFLDDVQKELDARTEEIYIATNTRFNLRSAQQLGEVLFSTLKLPTAGKTKGGQLSTAQEKLEKLAGHPVVDAVLEFRKLEKLRSTYLEPLPKLADVHGRIHTNFNQLSTATGRLSSSNPNLQNIPVRGVMGERMRTCFVPKPDCLLISADYSQIELRVLAHMSQDPVLLDAFKQGKDIHTSTAALIYGITPDQVSKDERRNAKTINFGLIYGMGAQKLAQELGITTPQAKEFIANYFKHLVGLKNFYDRVEAQTKELGYVSTIAGRRRIIPDIHSKHSQKFSLARRQAINTVIQGSAADIIKLAMLEVHNDEALRAINAKLILQIHDELLLEVPQDQAQLAGERVAQIMSQVAPNGQNLSVPLLVDWGLGGNWGLAH